jgi:cyclin L
MRVEDIHPTPSFVDGISSRQETELRIYGCELIQQAGFLLGLVQACTATSQVLFQQFYHTASMKDYDVRFIAMGALLLGTKVEEHSRPKLVRELISMFHHLLQPQKPVLEVSGTQYQPFKPATFKLIIFLQVASELYWDLKEDLFQAEMYILRGLGFHTKINHPHKYILSANPILHLDRETLQQAWNYCNDSLKTSVVIRWGKTPWVTAAACIYLAARQLQVSLPSEWYLLFDATLQEILEIIGELVQLYSRSTPARWSKIPGGIIPRGFSQVSVILSFA